MGCPLFLAIIRDFAMTGFLQALPGDLLYPAAEGWDILPMPPSPLSDAQAALAAFEQATGQPATHLVYAPGRVNLIGEHTDYNGGFVLPFAIDLGIYVAARPRTDRLARVASPQLSGETAEFDLSLPITKGEPSWSNYVRGTVAGLLEKGLEVPGFDAVIHASLPAGGGLSSSAALEAAFATLGEALTGCSLDPRTKALLCQKAEHTFAGTPCGIMDQFSVIFGREGRVLLIDCRSMKTRLVPMEGPDVTLLVINTMVKHELTDGGYKSRRDDCHEAARLLGVADLRDATPAQVDAAQSLLGDRLHRRARHVVTEDERTLAAVARLEKGEWEKMGVLMYASHASLRDDFEVSCEELNVVVEEAAKLGLAGGVYGCRMTGGGFGGCCIALVQTERAEAVAEGIRAAYVARTGIEPTIFATRPSNGASVLPLA